MMCFTLRLLYLKRTEPQYPLGRWLSWLVPTACFHIERKSDFVTSVDMNFCSLL